MSQFSSNLPLPLRSRSSSGSGATSDGQSLAPSSAVVPAPAIVVTHSSDGAGSLATVPSHGRRVYEDAIPPSESLEPTLRMDKGKQPTEEGFQHKRKRVVSVESEKSVPEEGLMADMGCIGRK